MQAGRFLCTSSCDQNLAQALAKHPMAPTHTCTRTWSRTPPPNRQPTERRRLHAVQPLPRVLQVVTRALRQQVGICQVPQLEHLPKG